SLQQRVAAEAVFRVREVGAEVASPALLPEPRARRHRPRDVQQVTVLGSGPAGRTRRRARAAALEPALEVSQRGAVALQAQCVPAAALKLLTERVRRVLRRRRRRGRGTLPPALLPFRERGDGGPSVVG